MAQGGTSTARIYEEYLVAGARLGDRYAIDRLVVHRGPKLFAHAMRLLGDRAEAEDVVQDAWIEILRGLADLRDERAFPAWAYRIVSRRAAKTIGGKIRQRTVAKDLGVGAETEAPEAGPAAADARAIRGAIATLPPDQAATIALFYLEEMTVTEVAAALDVPPGTVKTRLMHARTRLHEALKGDADEQT
ncbi:MAG: sigma-70 family RNA polymerase sigma factor [Pseudomonadota bacterium]